jgi:hypothetical protein
MNSDGTPTGLSRLKSIFLAADRVYHFAGVTAANCELLPLGLAPTRRKPRFGQAKPLFSPLPSCLGGIVSVALSLGFPPVAVSNCLSLCCPDFPLSYPLQGFQAISR